MDFSYVIDKIDSASIEEVPFRHLVIDELFSAEHFDAIIHSPDIRLKPSASDAELFQQLFDCQYRIIDFPGSTGDHMEYMRWHKDKQSNHLTNTSCEGFGVVMRLVEPQSDLVRELQAFLQSDEFVGCIARKFDVDPGQCKYDAGIQKYLDGYEISPHPDIRLKALTYMVNINPGANSEAEEHHTSYLRFKPEWQYVETYWRGNPKMDRGWVPWDWCEIEKQQRANNSLVIFSPADDTLHAVKADYDHLDQQRTQLYGNLWYMQPTTETTPRWEDLVVHPTKASPVAGSGGKVRGLVGSVLPGPIKEAIKKATGQQAPRAGHTDRKY